MKWNTHCLWAVMTSLAVHLKLCIYYVDHFVWVGLASVTVLHSGYNMGLSYWRRKKVLATSACILYLCCNVKIPPEWAKDFFSLTCKKWKQTHKKNKTNNSHSQNISCSSVVRRSPGSVGGIAHSASGRRGCQSKPHQSLSQPPKSCMIDHWLVCIT